MVKVQRLFAKTNLKIPVFETGKSEAEGDRLLRTYENKDELKNEINKSFAKYISEFNDIPEHLKDKRVDEIDRTPAENLAYQVGWTTLVIKWESDERKGIPVKTPSDNFKWNQLGELYQWFTDTYVLQPTPVVSNVTHAIRIRNLDFFRPC